jgi:plastocyanin
MRAKIVLLSAAAMLLAGALGSSMAVAAPAGRAARTAPGGRMVILAFTYLPTPVLASPGQRITVTNLDDAVVHLIPGHSVTANNGSFNTGVFFGTKTFHAPSARGRYVFHCLVHGFMRGVLVVR